MNPTMKAVTYTEYGSPDVLVISAVPKPVPKDNEVLIKVHATTVTTGDCNMRGFVFVPPGFKFISRMMFGIRKPNKSILGVELAGEIEAVGSSVQRFKVGDQVLGLDGTRVGAYAEYTCRPETSGLVIKPAPLSYEEAAALSNGALTAYTFLKKMGNVQSGQNVLIVGASGSVGSAAVQIAKHYGAHVTAVCSGKNADWVRSIGADKVIDYTKEDFTQNGDVYDIIFDTVGKTPFSRCRSALAAHGVFLASAAGLDGMLLMLRTSLFGSKKVKAGVSSERYQDLEFIKQLAEAGALKPVIDRSYPLEAMVEAHRYVDTGHKKGNVVITVVPSV